MRALLSGLAIALACSSLVVAQAGPTAASADRRNSEVRNTDTHAVMARFDTREAWESHRARVRQQILTAAGLDPMPERTPLRVERFGRLTRDGYTIEKVLIETWPGFFLGANLYMPTTPGPHPAVVSPHGHWPYGRLAHDASTSVPLRAANLARRGHVVVIHDMVGYNDTTQVPHSFHGQREALWGFSPLGLQLWNSIRVVDFLESLLEVDRTRIGATGASGGGTQTFLLSAVDDRIAYSAPVNMLSAYMQGGSFCENAPGLRLGISNVDIVSLAAPRPMLVVSATGDWTRHVPEEEFPAVRRIYELHGATDKVSNTHVDAPHNYNQVSREAMYRFFDAQAFGKADDGRERSAQTEGLADMLATVGRPKPALDYDGLFASWRRAAEAQAEAATDVAVLRARLRRVLGFEAPGQPDLAVATRDASGIISRGVGDRVVSMWTPGKGRPLVVVHPEGSQAGNALPEVAAARKKGRPVLVLQVFQTGSSVAPRDRSHDHFLTFNLSDDQARVHDIVAALAWLKAPRGADIVATGAARYWTALAVAALGTPHSLQFDVTELAADDATLERESFVPGLQRIGGIAAVRRLLASR